MLVRPIQERLYGKFLSLKSNLKRQFANKKAAEILDLALLGAGDGHFLTMLDLRRSFDYNEKIDSRPFAVATFAYSRQD